ncbi:MAG: ATP-dependent helicase [Oculatellaceae cyanobacterium bins.114]|nr:ATP-dependent helicase [Oculatellaceae cyanobacterium bins.114]
MAREDACIITGNTLATHACKSEMVTTQTQAIDPTALIEGIERLRRQLRPGQQRMADWDGGSLAVSAVPGSGKSTGMAIAAAILLAKRRLRAILHQVLPTDQLVLVTFTRSAAANLKAKIRGYLRELGLPTTGFAVYTLHGLALNIATRHPGLSGLTLDRLTLVSPTQNNRLIRACVEQWIAANPQHYQRLLEGQQFDGEESERLRRQSVLRTEVLPELATTVIHEAKSSGLLPAKLHEMSVEVRSSLHLSQSGDEADYDVLAIAAGLYENYQALLQQRHLIDYDDMILAALRVLENDSARHVWQQQVFAVFEDEAQDSSPLQTRLLEILAASPLVKSQSSAELGDLGGIANYLNLVRVGDPNQAINSTFTPADPVFFREFCIHCATQGRLAEMDQAGRSSQTIIDVANATLKWVNARYGGNPNSTPAAIAATDAQPQAPFRLQEIHPVSLGDPQADANPKPEGWGVEIRFPQDVLHSIELMAQRLADVFSRYPDGRAAILVRENRQGKWIADVLQNPAQYKVGVNLGELGIEIYDVGQRDRHSHVPLEILALLQFVDRPHSPDNLKAALKVLVDRQLIPKQDLNALTVEPEQFLYPGPLETPQPEPVVQARRYCTALVRARLELPLYQLISFLALTLKYDPTELATADKLAERIGRQTSDRQSMSTMLDALGEVVRSERFSTVETDDAEAQYTRPRQVTIITMHKAKGLDWDFVFIPFLHEQSIPGRRRLPPQAQFLGDFGLSEVARAQIRAHIHKEPVPGGEMAWHRAEYLQMAEEFRLLYVAMTRAKRLLWMAAERKAPFTWSNPDNLEAKIPCPVLPFLVERFPQVMQKS